MRTFRNLLIWQKAIDLVTETYRLTEPFPRQEVFGLTAQIRRSAISIPSNIAEGSGRETDKDLNRFLHIAMGSLFELQTQLEIARRITYLQNEQYNIIFQKSRELEAMMTAFLQKIR